MLDDATLLLSFNNNNKNIHKTNNLPVFDYVLVVSLIVFRARRREEYPGFFMCSTHILLFPFWPKMCLYLGWMMRWCVDDKFMIQEVLQWPSSFKTIHLT